jgi:hypothetical protein
LFETKDDAKFAFSERNGQNIGRRWIELYAISRKEWEQFGFEQQSKNTNLKNFLNDENIYRAVKLRGMPFHVNPTDIVEFFRDFNVTTQDVVIEFRNGKMTGFGLVFLDSP